MKKWTILIVALAAMLACAIGQDAQPDPKELAAFQQAMFGSAKPEERIPALERFVGDYPQSRFRGDAYAALFQTFVRRNIDDKELLFATSRKALDAAASDSSRGNIANTMAWAIASHSSGKHLAEAEAIAREGLAAFDKSGGAGQSRAFLEDTLGWIYHRQGRNAEALTQLKLSIQHAPGRSPEPYAHWITVAEKLQDEPGLLEARLAQAAAINLSVPFDQAKLRELYTKVRGSADGLDREVEENARRYVEVYLASVTVPMQRLSSAAALADGLLRRNLALDLADKIAVEALAAADPELPTTMPPMAVEQMKNQMKAGRTNLVRIRGNIALKRGDVAEATRLLQQAAADNPRDGRTAEALAQLYEKAGDGGKAGDMYLTAYVTQGGAGLLAKARTLLGVSGTAAEMEKLIDAKVDAVFPAFRPAGKHAGAPTGRVVLAELFTGSECGPCVAADRGFDGLLEYFGPEHLAVVEYHLHIPGPDPMTNKESEARATYYGVNSTPSTFFNGARKASGGGGLAQSQAKFDEYRKVIEPALTPVTDIGINIQAQAAGDKVTATFQVTGKVDRPKLRLRAVLVEETVHYTGANQIHYHHRAARHLLGGADGYALTPEASRFEAVVSISELSAALGKTHDEYEEKFKSMGRGLKERKHIVDAARLSLIAFVQDDATKEVLQARVFPLHGGAH